MSEELIINEIENNKEEYVEFLRELIKANSYNPPGNEKNVAIKIEEYLKNSNVKSEISQFGDNRANLIAYLNDNFEGKNLLYNGHMDVVPPGAEEDWKNPPLSAFVKRKKLIYGRGAADMKGALAAMTIALTVLKKLEIDLSGNLILTAVADEETGGNFGTKWCLKNKLNSIKCDFVVIGEPSGLNPLPKVIIIGEKGHLVLKLVTNGISCHSSMPTMGKNAIYMMSEIIQNLDKIDDYVPNVKPPIPYDKLKQLVGSAFTSIEIFENIFKEQPLLQNLLKSLVQFTKSLNIISAGIKENVVPNKCEAIFDFRLLPGQKVEDIVNAVKKLITEDVGYAVKDVPTGAADEIFVYLKIVGFSEGSYWKDWENSTVLKDLYDLIESIYKKKPFYLIMPASADAKYYRNDGYCPETILFGPGNAATAHSVNEYIETQDFLNAIKVYALFAYNFLK